MPFMKAFRIFLRRYIWVAAIVAAIALGLSIYVQTYKGTYTVAGSVFRYFNDWSIVISAFITLTLALAAFWAISDNRHSRFVEFRKRSLDEIRDWAIECFQTTFSLKVAAIDVKNTRKQLNLLNIRGVAVEADAVEIDNNLGAKIAEVRKTVKSLLELIEANGDRTKEEESLEKLVEEIVTDTSKLRAEITTKGS